MANGKAFGAIETFGIVFALEAADAMSKAANVEIKGYENVGSGYISILIEGDVSSCNAAVDAGVEAVKGIGGEVHSSVVIASPHRDLYKITERYNLENLA